MNHERNRDQNIKQAVPFFAVSDMQKSLRFYLDALGFNLKLKWPDQENIRWCYLENGGAGIMLQEYSKEGQDAWVPSGKLGEGVSICFICADAVVIYHEITSRGVNASEPVVANGMWNTCLRDPDGYKLEFESYTSVPEETKLSEWKA